MKKTDYISKSNKIFTAWAMILAVLNIVMLPFFHEHEIQFQGSICKISIGKNSVAKDMESSDDCNVCRFINKHTILSLVIDSYIKFYPPMVNSEPLFAKASLLTFLVDCVNKDPPRLYS